MYGNLGEPQMYHYIKLFFCHVINGVNTINNTSNQIIIILFFLKVNQRFKNSLQNDPDLMITVSLSNVLILV